MFVKYVFESSMPPTKINAVLLHTGTKRFKVNVYLKGWNTQTQISFCSKVDHTCAALSATPSRSGGGKKETSKQVLQRFTRPRLRTLNFETAIFSCSHCLQP